MEEDIPPEFEDVVDAEEKTSLSEGEDPAEETDPGGDKPAPKATRGGKGKSSKAKAKSRNMLAKDSATKKDLKKKGQKYCPPCGKAHPIEMFAVGAGQCRPGQKSLPELEDPGHCAESTSLVGEGERRPSQAEESFCCLLGQVSGAEAGAEKGQVRHRCLH